MGKRKTIPKKTRFEVFKRDKFTCQYCGRMAPDVVLEIDHIKPVSKGGDNSIMNLITACFDCNRGKGDRKLTQNAEIKKQQHLLEKLAERKEQIEMMLEWKKGLENLNEDLVDIIDNILQESTGCHFNELGRKDCKKWIEKYGFNEVYESTKISINQYYIEDDKESIRKSFNYIERICATRKKQKDDPLAYDISYLCKIGKNRFSYFNYCIIRQILEENYEKEDFNKLKTIFTNAPSN